MGHSTPEAAVINIFITTTYKMHQRTVNSVACPDKITKNYHLELSCVFQLIVLVFLTNNFTAVFSEKTCKKPTADRQS